MAVKRSETLSYVGIRACSGLQSNVDTPLWEEHCKIIESVPSRIGFKPDFPDQLPDFPDHCPDFPDHLAELAIALREKVIIAVQKLK
jgi:hypothetical protein